ncbi:envelope biogenesis factor ElyC [Dickeya zeae]|uniref:envelope biogenesis factor ElyC n=1 Tax=Dickeya zeae TaxID=204042 RepID=UPI00206D193A|nr:envelope biogenesis factor ElyC [Dickeya zeae]UPT56195.1 envelope biogenesis factor ElyC [Dickeya zeae]
MLFAVKKYIGSLLLPLPLLMLVLGIALALLWFSRWQKTARIMLTGGWLVLLLLSLQPVADRLLLPLESRYPTWTPDFPNVNYIVVLGGGYTFNPDWPPSANLINNSLARVTEGIRLWRANPGAKLIFTGAAAQGNPVTSASTAARVAESLGVPAQDILLVDKAHDTEEEAAGTEALIGKQPFLLVTSANHLPRAIRFFQARGLHPIPAPANQLAITSPLNPWERVFPSALYLSHSERAWYEGLGLIWQQMKGVTPQPES